MAKKKFYQSLGYKLMELMNDLAIAIPRAELYGEYYKRVHGISAPNFHSVIYGLEKKKLIKREKKGRQCIFKITSVGMRKFFIGNILNNFLREKEKKWDGKWRIVIFDIPEKQKNMREFLRRELFTNNFYMLQKSVWITPYKISDYFEHLLKELNLEFYVRFIVAEHINYERDLLKHFRSHLS